VNSIKINISPNKLSALLSINADLQHFPSEEEIFRQLSLNNIVYGLDKSLIAKVAKEKKSVISIVIAQGRLPVGKLNWHIEIENPYKPTITKTNRADFKKLTSYHFIQKNSKIVSMQDNNQVKNGMTVSGQEIAPEAEHLHFPEYENIILSENKKTLLAAVSGYILWKDNTLVIEDVLHIKGNVDYSTGNLKLKGSVVIEGDVRSGFRVETDGSIFVGGSVDAANIVQVLYFQTITNGILGQGRAKVLCGGSLKCAFIQDANVAAQKDVILEKYSLNSVISSGGSIQAKGEDCLIRGGILTAEKGIEINDVGSERAVQTELKIRSYTDGESQSQLWQLNREKSSYSIRLSSLNKRKDFLLVLKRGIEKLSEDKMSELNFIEHEIERLKKKLKSLEADEIRLSKETSIHTINKEILIHGTLYTNVQVDIGGASFKCDDPISGVRLVNFKEEIVLESLKDQTSPDYDIYIKRN